MIINLYIFIIYFLIELNYLYNLEIQYKLVKTIVNTYIMKEHLYNTSF